MKPPVVEEATLGKQDEPVVAGAGQGPAALPFTGIEDTYLPMALAFFAFAGGVMLYRHAASRESLLAAAGRTRRFVSGYRGALESTAEPEADQRATRQAELLTGERAA